MSGNTKDVDISPGKDEISDSVIPTTVTTSDITKTVGNIKSTKGHQPRATSSSDRQIKFERAQKCLENAALVSKRIKEHRKATAELLGRPFDEDDVGDTASEMTSTVSERTSYSAVTDTSTTLSVQDALNIPGISESLANTLKQKELLMERIKQYKEISKRPPMKSSSLSKRDSVASSVDNKKVSDNNEFTKLQNTIKEKENVISVLQVKMKALENMVMDLQEKVGEKDMLIEAKTKATSLMSDSLSKKEMDSLALLEDTRQQMHKMQENFIAMESEWKEEKIRLVKDIEEKDLKIKWLEEANTTLERSSSDINIAHSITIAELEEKKNEITKLKEQIMYLTNMSTSEKITELDLPPKYDNVDEKGSVEIANMVELSKRVELLEQLNCQIRQTNKELENKLSLMNADNKPLISSSPKKGSPLPTRKGVRSTSSKVKSPWSNLSETTSQEPDKKQYKTEVAKLEMLIQSLNKEIIDKEFLISQNKGLISNLEDALSEKDTLIHTLKHTIVEKETLINTLNTDTERNRADSTSVDNVESEEIKPIQEDCTIIELENKLRCAENQVAALNEEIDSANKNMIKVKSNHKIKMKQMQKTIDNFSKMSDVNAEITKLNDEVHQLTQKVAELEEEKGNLQLHLVDYDSGRLTESEAYKKLVEIEFLAESRLEAISILESQKFDLVQELHDLQQKNVEMEDKLADMSHLQNEHVCSEIQSVQLEEQLDELIVHKREMELIVENLKLDKEQMADMLKTLEREKNELSQKLEHCIQENIELTGKLEKLSAEKVSSAESIEIVESLTTQEKLELEEYNKTVITNKDIERNEEFKVSQHSLNESLQKLTEESAELNKKIELFTLERQEVMEKMNVINSENNLLQNQISQLSLETSKLQDNIENLNVEKVELQTLNIELKNQIDELRRERMEIIKESSTLSQTISNVEDTPDNVVTDLPHDDRSSSEKAGKGAKSVKQLTKDILKLKNIIKEREDEIADCQMKILALAEQQQKHAELIQSNETYEMKLKALNDEKKTLEEELNELQCNRENENTTLIEEIDKVRQEKEMLQIELNKIHNEYNATIAAKDYRVNELENLLSDYEKQMFGYSETLQVKDKQLSEYINQITKLNDVSQKLKSTIECLEEEKAKDQNAELVKSLNKQISIYQNTLTDYEQNLKLLEEEKSKLLSLKSVLESKNNSLENELKNMHQTLLEKEVVMQELQQQQQRISEDVSAMMSQVKERDEEIHEVKLQLRKESIENEKLRKDVEEKENLLDVVNLKLGEENIKLNEVIAEKNSIFEQHSELETRNKDTLEKLKKFALSLKNKNEMCAELEKKIYELENVLDSKEQGLQKGVKEMSELQVKIVDLETELSQLQSLYFSKEQQEIVEINKLQNENKDLQAQLLSTNNQVYDLKGTINVINEDLSKTRDENTQLKLQNEKLNNEIVDFEIERKNSTNTITKIDSLEADLYQKQINITDLLAKLESLEHNYNKAQFGHDAKIQERDLYIENLEQEISKYKSRIGRLEETISEMEDRRHSLERKADQLDVQLQEKYKSYNEYANQEDELINRLAVLMDHDRVVEKQLHEIDKDNKDLQFKIQNVHEDNVRLRKIISDIQSQFDILTDKASKTESFELELTTCNERIRELENLLKKVTNEHQSILIQKRRDIEDLESEFNTQIENSIKEKKILSEKYERINEHVSKLEQKLNEYKANINNLNINLEEMSKINQELIDKSKQTENYDSRNYTDQYINEINNLNAILNSKNQEIVAFGEHIKQIQSSYNNSIVMKQMELDDMKKELTNSSMELVKMNNALDLIKNSNDVLKQEVMEKDEQVKQLIEKKTVSFEMNIPKTEGLVISSTIEEMSLEPTPRIIDTDSIEAQIVTDESNITSHEDNKFSKESLKHILPQDKFSGNVELKCVEEPIIVPKATYLCYKSSDTDTGNDPFNSNDGWGFDDTLTGPSDIIQECSLLNEQILALKKDNETLKLELESNKGNLEKALKTLKDMKAHNDMLSNELKISKQLSQSTFLDSAIEDELREQNKELNKAIVELQSKLSSEKRENASLRKQNEVLGTGNDRLTEIKEKLDNEVELWKFKFKDINDKMSSLQWESEPKEEPTRKPNLQIEEDLLEKENNELHNQIDQLIKQNNDLSLSILRLKDELSYLKEQHSIIASCKNCTSLKERVLLLETETKTKHEENNLLKLQLEENIQNENKMHQQFEECTETYSVQVRELNETCSLLKSDLKKANEEILNMRLAFTESENSLRNSSSSDKNLEEKYNALHEQYILLKAELESSNQTRTSLEQSTDQMMNKINDYEKQSEDMNLKLQKLNAENDQLLSSVAELRSSLSSAVDQRGYEIAEMWKQHLAQREAEFARIEQDLREKLMTSDQKYEHLLDNVQTSSQEETNKLIMLEQLNTFQNKLKDKEDHLVDLQNKYAEVLNQNDILRSEMEDEKLMHENKLLTQLEEYEKQMNETAANNENNVISYKNELTQLQSELKTTKENDMRKLKETEDLKIKLNHMELQVSEMANELNIKNSEIFQKTQDFNLSLSQRNEEFESVRQHLLQYEKKIEDLSFEKESELAILRLKIHDNMSHYDDKQKEYEQEKQNLIDSLNLKISECINLNNDMTALNNILQENTVKMTEMQGALENQELEIVTLKDEIVNLQDLLKLSTNKMDKRVTFASDTKLGHDDVATDVERRLNNELLDTVPRAELDLALYMLHQRDVRCEELTMELTQLLEERDTLQLRLSDSLRSFEDLRNKCKSVGDDVLFSSTQESVQESPVSSEKDQPFVDIHKSSTSRTSSVSETDGEKPQLQAKLSELRSVRQARDVRFRNESEQREHGMRLLQRDVARLPPEAADQLRQAHHTLSRDTQSTSTVLLNWLRGKSTPKVVHM